MSDYFFSVVTLQASLINPGEEFQKLTGKTYHPETAMQDLICATTKDRPNFAFNRVGAVILLSLLDQENGVAMGKQYMEEISSPKYD